MNPAKWLLCWLADVHFLGHSCNLILTRIFTFNFNAAVKPDKRRRKHFQLADSQLSPLQNISTPVSFVLMINGSFRT